MGRVMQNASFSLAQVSYVTGDIGYQVRESTKSAAFKIEAMAGERIWCVVARI